VRPPESYTEPIKLRQLHEYRLPGSASSYEEDHLIALSLGGSPTSLRNLWPQPRYGPHTAEEKDELETWAARQACSRSLPLAWLQQHMAHDWPRLYRFAGGARVLGHYPSGG
jgi:hypothetical protein